MLKRISSDFYITYLGKCSTNKNNETEKKQSSFKNEKLATHWIFYNLKIHLSTTLN